MIPSVTITGSGSFGNRIGVRDRAPRTRLRESAHTMSWGRTSTWRLLWGTSLVAGWFVVSSSYPCLALTLKLQLSTVTSLTKLLSTASSLPSFTPSLGHTYLPSVTKNPTPGSSLQATQASKEGTPMPGGGTPLPATQETATSAKASKTTSDMGLQGIHMLAYSYELSDRYANEYMDENPIVGEPGSFKLSKSHNTSLASSMITSKTSSQTQEVSKPSSQSLDVASPAKSAVPTPQLKTEDLPAPVRKATKGSEKSPITPGTKEKKSRRKSKAAGDKGATTPKATTPKPATPG